MSWKEKSELKNERRFVSLRETRVTIAGEHNCVSRGDQHVGGLSHTGVSLKFHHAPGHSPQTPFSPATRSGNEIES